MKAKDMAVELAETEKRRLGGKMSYEEAILSRDKIADENRRKVAEMKEKVSLGLLIFSFNLWSAVTFKCSKRCKKN